VSNLTLQKKYLHAAIFHLTIKIGVKMLLCERLHTLLSKRLRSLPQAGFRWLSDFGFDPYSVPAHSSRFCLSLS
jgi:hypothetical protein